MFSLYERGVFVSFHVPFSSRNTLDFFTHSVLLPNLICKLSLSSSYFWKKKNHTPLANFELRKLNYLTEKMPHRVEAHSTSLHNLLTYLALPLPNLLSFH